MNQINLDLFLDPSKQDEVLKQAQSREKNSGWFNDPTILRPQMKDGSTNVIEGYFLPNPYPITSKDDEGKEVVDYKHIVKTWEHWYTEGTEKVKTICPRRTENELSGSWDKPCPICDYVKETYPYVKGKDADNKEHDKRKASGTAYINFYVLNDALFPENNGKVFKLELPGKIEKALKDKIDGEKDKKTEKYLIQPENIFTFPNIRRFRIRVSPNSTNEKWRCFDNSGFLDKEVAFDGDMEKIKEILSKTHNLWEDVMVPALEKMPSKENLDAMVKNLYGGEFDLTKHGESSVSDIPEFKTPTSETPVAESKPAQQKVEEKAEEKVEPKVEAESGIEESVTDDIPAFDFDPSNYS